MNNKQTDICRCGHSQYVHRGLCASCVIFDLHFNNKKCDCKKYVQDNLRFLEEKACGTITY